MSDKYSDVLYVKKIDLSEVNEKAIPGTLKNGLLN